MKLKLVILSSVLMLAACNNPAQAVEEVHPGTLICNPINPSVSEPSAALTVKWKDNIVSFIDSHKFHLQGEKFVFDQKTEVWDSYCKERSTPNGEYKINYCSNAGKVSFFNGRTLIIQGIEMKCRNVEQLRF